MVGLACLAVVVAAFGSGCAQVRQASGIDSAEKNRPVLFQVEIVSIEIGQRETKILFAWFTRRGWSGLSHQMNSKKIASYQDDLQTLHHAHVQESEGKLLTASAPS